MARGRLSQRGGTMSNQWMSLLITFLLGYFTASVFDLKTIVHWVNTQILAEQAINKSKTVAPQKAEATVSKQKFEFYTLLTHDKDGKQHHVNEASKTPQGSPATSGSSTGNGTTTLAQNAVQSAPTAPIRDIASKTPPQPTSTPAHLKNTYLIQVASFKAKNDADQMKGILTLKGLDVTVIPVSNDKGNWFRVIIGPYPNRESAQKVQSLLAKNEHIKGIITSNTHS